MASEAPNQIGNHVVQRAELAHQLVDKLIQELRRLGRPLVPTVQPGDDEPKQAMTHSQRLTLAEIIKASSRWQRCRISSPPRLMVNAKTFGV